MADDDIAARCVCGHLYPEHTIEGACRGCAVCTVDGEGDHPYERCTCDNFEVEMSHAIGN